MILRIALGLLSVAALAVAGHFMSVRFLPSTIAGLVADLRKDFVPRHHHGFELLVDDATAPRVQHVIDSWFATSVGTYALTTSAAI